jgi:sulfur relay (sulfurtransferase) complex TusBCD TusD component (DsrE family)
LILVLDEPPAMNDSVSKKIQSVLETAAAKGIRIIPVVGSGEGYDKDKNMEYLMRSLALATNGTYVFLTDHSQIGNTHTKPETDEYNVEILNELLKRLICQYTYVPSCDKPADAKGIQDTMYVFNPKIVAHEVLNIKKFDKTETAADTAFADNDSSADPKIQAIMDTLKADSIAKAEAENSNIINKEKFHNFKFYPNPTNGEINIEFDGKVEEIYLSDVSGKLLEKYKAEGSRLKIDISKYPSGIYFLQYMLNEKWLSGKVIKS